jgi:hypothetical protein
VRVETDGDLQYAMTFGAGAVYHGIVLARGRIEAHGVNGQLRDGLALATFLTKAVSGKGGALFPTLHAEFGIDGEWLPPQSYFGVLASTIDRQILGISPYWGVGPGPLRFSALGTGPRHLARAILPVLRGRPSAVLRPEFGYRSVNCTEVEARFDSGYTLDGELFAARDGATRVMLSGRQCGYFLRARP